MAKRIAICIGSKSSINQEKLRLKFEQYSTGDALAFYQGPANRQGVVELAAFLVLQDRDADIWVVIQGTKFQDGKEERMAEEVQMLVQGASIPYIDYLFWNDRVSPEELGTQNTEPEELFARQLYEMLGREVLTKH